MFMRKEAENLLRLLGSNQQIGTHGAISILDALKMSIKTGEDRHGVFPKMSLDQGAYRKAVHELVPFLDVMSESAFGRYLFFANDIGQLNYRLGKEIKEGGVLEAYFPEQIEKRARFLVNFTGVTPKLFTRQEMYREERIYVDHPWMWISAMEGYSPQSAESEIVSQIVKGLCIAHVSPLITLSSPSHIRRILSQVKGKIPGRDFVRYQECLNRRVRMRASKK